MADQLENERRLTGDATFKTLMKEMITIPGNRKRAIISVMLMICQQMTGVNAIVSCYDDEQPLSTYADCESIELLRPPNLQKSWDEWY